MQKSTLFEPFQKYPRPISKYEGIFLISATRAARLVLSPHMKILEEISRGGLGRVEYPSVCLDLYFRTCFSNNFPNAQIDPFRTVSKIPPPYI